MTKTLWMALVLILTACGEQRPPAPTAAQNDQLDEAEAMLNEEAGTTCHDTVPAWDQADLHLRPVEKISVRSDGQLTWNGQVVPADELVLRLNEARWTNEPSPAVAFERDPALSCNQVERVRSLMKTTTACTHGKCAEVDPPPE